MELIIRTTLGVGIATILFTIVFVTLDLKKRLLRRPVSEKMLRPAGESSRLRLEDLNVQLCVSMLACMAVSMISALTFKFPINAMEITIGTLLFASAAFWFLLTVKLWRRYHLGFSGERLVAEQLNKMQMKGCYVFHDIPKDGTGNIDHVVVARSGVYAIETKTRRKMKTVPGKDDYKILFDGHGLEFPNYYSRVGLTQCKENADWLSDELSKALAEPIKVTPILTFPGWYIELKARSDFPILNPKNIESLVLSNAMVLDDKKLKQIAFYMERQCRDVEF